MTDLANAKSAPTSTKLDHTAVMRQDDDGFRAFYERERHKLVRTVGLLTTDTRYVEDAVQEALLIARHHWITIRHYDNPGAWALRVAMQQLRRWQARDQRLHRPWDEQVEPEDEQAAGATASTDEQRDLVAAVRRLPARQRDCVALHYLRDLPIAQVAEILGVAEGTVKAQLSAARARLQQLLASDGEEGQCDEPR